jgi:hypothetical protein
MREWPGDEASVALIIYFCSLDLVEALGMGVYCRSILPWVGGQLTFSVITTSLPT